MFHEFLSELHYFYQYMGLEDIHTMITDSISPFWNIKVYYSRKKRCWSVILCIISYKILELKFSQAHLELQIVDYLSLNNFKKMF